MHTELIIYFVIPTFLAVVAIAASIMAFWQTARIGQILISVPVSIELAWALLILKRMFFDNVWPTFLPYYIIGLCAPIVVGQILLTRHRPAP
jgi:hypothetical protein